MNDNQLLYLNNCNSEVLQHPQMFSNLNYLIVEIVGTVGFGLTIIITSQAQPEELFEQPFCVTASSPIPPLTFSASNTDISSIEKIFRSFMLIFHYVNTYSYAFRIPRLLYRLVCGIIVDSNLSFSILFHFDFSFSIPPVTLYLDNVNTGSQNRKFSIQ